MKWAKNRFQCQRARAKKRNITFELTFDEWYQWWLSHGVDKNYKPMPGNNLKGNGPKNLCMCRIGDVGGYSLTNIYCATSSKNAFDRNQNKPMLASSNPMARSIHTPDGRFSSLADAAKHYQVTLQAIYMRLRRNPKGYQYV